MPSNSSMSTTCTVVIRLFSREYMNFKACKRYTWTVHMDGILEGEERSDHSVRYGVLGFRFQVSGLSVTVKTFIS